MVFEIWKKTKNTYSRTLLCCVRVGNVAIVTLAQFWAWMRGGVGRYDRVLSVVTRPVPSNGMILYRVIRRHRPGDDWYTHTVTHTLGNGISLPSCPETHPLPLPAWTSEPVVYQFQSCSVKPIYHRFGRPLAAAADTADDVQHQQQVDDVWNMSWPGQAGQLQSALPWQTRAGQSQIVFTVAVVSKALIGP